MAVRAVPSFLGWCVIVLHIGVLVGCDASLPEPESAGAQLYRARCRTCHRLYAPSSLKFDLWKMQVELMQGEMVRRGLPPLTRAERELLLDYLRRHSDGGLGNRVERGEQ